MSGSRHKARIAAIQALYQWELTEQPPEAIEDHFLYEHDLGEADQAWFHELVRQVPLHLHELDDHLMPYLGREMDSVDPVEQAILRLGAYELRFHEEIPYRVILDEAIRLAKTFGSENSYRFVNGVLDRVAAKLRAQEVSRTTT
ncbi:MAG: transcription antitermination factor NusB [Gammaproteobacteria bacterium]|nr:transcription antitermination factor NusB [Gammaproteobacteria bacterium]